MEQAFSLKAEIRDQTGSKEAARLRQQRRIPAIVYGHKEAPVAVSFDAHDFVEGIHHGHRLFDIQLGKSKQKTIVKDIQYDHLGKEIIHADLVRVDITEMVKIRVPLELKGTAKGSREGGIIEEHTDHLELECKVTQVPDVIVVNVKDVGIGDSIHAGDLALPEAVKLISEPSTLLVTCHLVAAAKSTEELAEQMPAAPEVIGEKEAVEAEPSQQEGKE